MLLAGNPKRAHEFLDRLVEIHLANLEKFLAAVGRSIDIIAFGDDLGMQNGPQMSKAMYQEFFKPRHARMWHRAKELAPVKVMLHCCGGIRPLIPDLIEAGLDAVNPVQITCRGMEAEGLKRDFGDKITFWGGGCDTRFVLSHANAGGNPKARPRADFDSCAGRRFRVPAGSQHFGRRAAGEHSSPCSMRRMKRSDSTSLISRRKP